MPITNSWHCNSFQVLSVLEGGEEVELKYLRKKSGKHGYYHFPDADDIHTSAASDCRPVQVQHLRRERYQIME